MTKLFPPFPQDPQSLGIIKGINKLSSVIKSNNLDDDLNNCSRYLLIVTTLPLTNHELYFNLYNHLLDYIQDLSDNYNTSVYQRGEKYMLKTINREVGEFGMYFDSFQLLMYSLNERADWDERLEPFNTLIWGFYCCLFDMNYRSEYFERCFKFIENSYRV